MKILNYEEHEDGSATIEIVLELYERERLIEIGMITALKNFLKELEDGDNT